MNDKNPNIGCIFYQVKLVVCVFSNNIKPKLHSYAETSSGHLGVLKMTTFSLIHG